MDSPFGIRPFAPFSTPRRSGATLLRGTMSARVPRHAQELEALAAAESALDALHVPMDEEESEDEDGDG